MYYSFIMLKPDALKKELVEQIMQYLKKGEIEIERLGYKKVTEDILSQHYAEVIEKYGPEFKEKLMKYFYGNFVLPMVVRSENSDIISKVRLIVGATNPAEAAEGTIRGDLCDDSFEQCSRENRSCENLIHASDSPETVRREIGIWFGKGVAELYC